MPLAKYQDMKDSGVAWLGEIPANWQLLQTRYIFNISKDVVGDQSSDYKLLSLTLRGIIPRSEVEGGKNPEKYDTYQVVHENDLIMCLFDYDVTPRTVGRATQTGMVTGAYTVLKPAKQISARFYAYFFLALDDSKELLHLCTGLRNGLSKPTFFSLKLPLPNYATQARIADFLDEETAKIDNLIAKQEKLLQLLEEKRRATITHAVTRGLNPNVKFKETNIPWLRYIPRQWITKKLKNIGDAIIGLTYSPSDLSDNGTLVLRSMNIKNGKINTDTQIFVSKIIPDRLFTQSGDILICSRNGSRSLIGKCGLIKKDQTGLTFGVFNTVFRSNMNEYVYFVLNSNIFEYQKGLFMTSTINQLTVNTLNNFEIAIPPPEEQKEIVSYLKKENMRVDYLKQKIQTQISLLKERRTSLISHAVTGKIKI